MSLRFGTFELDPLRRQVRSGGTPVHLTPKAFDFLCLLVSEAPRVLDKRELHERLWPGIFVSDASLSGLVKEIRQALGHPDAERPVIRTVHRVGYACGYDVEVVSDVLAQGTHWLVVSGRRLPLRSGENIVGREPASSVWLEESGVSRRHARIVLGSDGCMLEDLGSKNGTTVGDLPVTGAVRLSDGDGIRFGPVLAVYRASRRGMSTVTHAAVSPLEPRS